ncbi:MAG: DNA polymerase III subunit epsilon [Bacteroidetes bacterium]|nr:DNA polymerase III subunit epsilon [Bacteroidota bacterium]
MEAKYAIIDIETTGGRAAKDKITEIAIVIHNGTQVLETFETLLNPETTIPYGITELTGISNEMVMKAPRFYEIAKKVVEMTEGAVFVAHNVRFDYSFIQEEFRRLGYTYSRRQLCTVRLARKVFPGYRSYSLGNLIVSMGLNAGDRHRAMGDTIATVDLFERILAQSGSATKEIQKMINLGVKESKLPKNFSVEKMHNLPEACGVYYFHNENGDVVYVGKSRNIKKRIAEHFSNQTEKAAKLQAQVDDVSWEETGSELVALLKESHEIKKLLPSINRAQKVRSYPFVIHAFENQAGYLCFDVAKPTLKTRKNLHVISAYQDLAHAKGWLKGAQKRFNLCLRHCHLDDRSGPCFDYHLKQCFGACIGEEKPKSYNERAQAALLALDESLLEQDFFLIDKGRTPDENAVVLVEGGEYQGYGFVNLEEVDGNDFESLREAIEHFDSNPEVKRIIRRFLGGNHRLKIIKLTHSVE